MPLRQPLRRVIGRVQPQAILQPLCIDPEELIHLEAERWRMGTRRACM